MDGPLLPATLYQQLHAPFSCFGRWSDESERRWLVRLLLPGAVGKFFQVEYFEAWVENTAPVPLEIRPFAESPGRF